MKIPVIRGSIGNWIYYTGVMNFKQIADKITTSINEMYETSCLDEVLQRALTENYQSIKVSVKPPCGLNCGSGHETISQNLKYLSCSPREVFDTLGDGQKWSKVCK